MIKGLRVLELPVPEDDRGALIKIVQSYQLPGGLSVERLPTTSYGEAAQKPGRFGEVYVVHDPMPHTVRAFHKHFILWDYFCIIRGSAKFAFVDDRQNGVPKTVKWAVAESPLDPTYIPKPGEGDVVVASGARPRLLVVPPGIFHGWMSLEPDTLMVSVGTELYDPQDEVRVPPDYFYLLFGEDIWEVRGR